MTVLDLADEVEALAHGLLELHRKWSGDPKAVGEHEVEILKSAARGLRAQYIELHGKKDEFVPPS